MHLLLESKQDIKKKPALLQYKNLIIQLSEAINNLNKQNQELKQQKLRQQHKIELLLQNLRQKQQIIDQMSAKVKKNQELTTAENLQLSRLKKSNNFQQEKIISLVAENHMLSNRVKTEIEKKNQYYQINKLNLQKIRILQQNIENLIDQNRKLYAQIRQKDCQNERQIKELKQFNQQLKRKFQILQIDRNQEFNHNFLGHSPSTINKISQRQKRTFSSQYKDKTKRNNGCFQRSNITKIPNDISKFKLVNEYSPIERMSYLSRTVQNPELKNQLQNIKSQIAHQYTLINLKSQNYCKSNVNKTLEQIKKRMNMAIHIAQQSDHQSAPRC